MLILLGQFDGLLVLLVSSVKVSRDSSEFDKVVMFGGLSEGKLINIFVLSDGSSESFVVFRFKVDVVKSIIDGLVVLSLDVLQEGSDQSNMASVFQLEKVR